MLSNKRITSSIQNAVKLSFLLVFAFIFFSCTTTAKLETTNETAYTIPENSKGNNQSSDYKYIYIRLYNAKYNNPFCPENILKNLINFVDVSKVQYNHSAIGFGLEDEFYGLTVANEQNLHVEHCTNTEDNKYMHKCNPEKSVQAVFFLKVTNKEYRATKRMVQKYINDKKTKYDVGLNFNIGFYSFGRKYFTFDSQKKQFGSTKNSKINKKNTDEEHNFICSSFISYVLYNNVESIRKFFDENGLNYVYVLPSDIASFPGVEKCFSSTWDEYLVSAENYIKENPTN